jgi:hypothetical protein
VDSSLPSFLNLQPLAPSASCSLLSALCSLLLTILTDTTHEPAVNKDVHQPAVLFTITLLVRSTLLRKCGKAAEYVRRTIAAHSITPPPQPFRVSGSLTDDSPPTLVPPPRAPLLLPTQPEYKATRSVVTMAQPRRNRKSSTPDGTPDGNGRLRASLSLPLFRLVLSHFVSRK